MPPPPDVGDPSQARPFLDPYGRAKTVRIGKWRWPPPQEATNEDSDSFLQFKMRQHRKSTPQRHISQVCLFWARFYSNHLLYGEFYEERM